MASSGEAEHVSPLSNAERASSPTEVPVKEAVLVKLSDGNRRFLLGNAAILALERQSDATIMLTRLFQLNEELAEQFQYKKSLLQSLTLRMLFSSGSGPAQDPEAQVSSYLIISYCWHDKTWAAAPAAAPLTTWGLSKPMVNKILDLRVSENEGVWIDKHCIDQQNEDEKKIAIGSMDIIYRAARRLVIAFEDVQLDEKEENVGLKYAQMYEKMCIKVGVENPQGFEKLKMMEESFNHDSPDIDNIKRFLLKMLSARWFSRAWCAHESKVTTHGKINNPLFLCFGADGSVLSFEFRFVHFFAFYAKRKFPEYANLRGGDSIDALYAPTDPNTLFKGIAKIHSLRPNLDPSDSFMTYLVKILSFDCTQKTDMVSIALNLSRVPLSFRGTVDPKYPETYFWIYALLTIASGDAAPLLIQAKNVYFLNKETKRQAISWVDMPYVSALKLPKVPILSPNTIHGATVAYIELDLFVFTNMPTRASAASLAKARSILEMYSLMNRSHNLGVDDAEYKDYIDSGIHEFLAKRGLDTNWFVEFLGSAIDNGIDWIRRLPDILDEETKSNEWSHGRFHGFEAGFSNAAIDLLSYFNITRESNDDFNSEFLNPTIRFFTCLTDRRLRLPIALPRRIKTKSNSDFAFTGGISDRSWIAVPVALAHLPFYENKVWVLEPGQDLYLPPENLDIPKNPKTVTDIFPILTSDMADRRDPQNAEGTWCLRLKQKLVGCQPIVADGEAIRLCKKQRVYGGENYDWQAIIKQQRDLVEKMDPKVLDSLA